MRVLKIVAVTLLLLFLLGAGAMIFFLSPADSGNIATKIVVIAQGSSRAQIAQELFDAGVIKNNFAFFAYTKLAKVNAIPGTYEFSPSLSGSTIAEKLARGEFKTIKITIIEGWRATDIESYLVSEKNLPQMQGFAAKAAGDEGYLFPDTYDLRVDITIDELIAMMKKNFSDRTAGLNVTPDAVILASIVEREAANDSERADIAGVYTNRLKIGMKLEADPTVQYAKGNWKAVTIADYTDTISPYNTYLNPGLPPGPICNSGLKSIQAALNPIQNGYYYFFHAQGQTYFSVTYQEHEAKIKKYF
ncbi:MAG TPA: endolytic transglycosylase MltG [Candidatus Saccharimonadales bacterium]|nr:endolytic transglycosylase MltG [Candidatus Saccharimonadales bacterium]